MRKLVLGLVVAAACVGFAGSAVAQDFPLFPAPDKTPITGKPRILKSSELALDNKRVVFIGVDPAMPGMPCQADGKAWDCGAAAQRILMNFIGREDVTCEPRNVDLFRRVFAKCMVHGQDIALELIEQGVAVALPDEAKDYVDAEQAAKGKKIGIWRGPFETPAQYRLRMSRDPMPR
jgi:endonuclease YncB( thermonuclease family)